MNETKSALMRSKKWLILIVLVQVGLALGWKFTPWLLPPVVVVHSLQLDVPTGLVYLDSEARTRLSSVTAEWTATVEIWDTKVSIVRCEGSGARSYLAGRKVATFALDEWVGRPECTLQSLPPGQYALRASWTAGGISRGIESLPFFIAEDGTVTQ